MWKLERKLNGWRFLMHFGRDLERTYLTGRRVSERTGVYSEKGLLVPQLWVTRLSPPHIAILVVEPTTHAICALQASFRPDVGYTVLDGEIMPPPGCGFRDVASFMNSDYRQVQATIAKWGSPSFHAFDILFADGQDLREQAMLDRRQALLATIAGVSNRHVMLVPQLSPQQLTYDEIVANGGEGVVLKRIDAPYGESGAWIKVKRVSTLDVVVTGFTAGKGKYSGQVGAVKVSVYSSSGELLEIAQVSGMSDTVRQQITDHQSDWLGRVVEIEAQEWGRDRLLHPRFVRERPDSDARACTFDKMTQDLGRGVEEKAVVAATAREQTELKL
jgi:ATP-dependent DNA ligase